MLQEFDCVNFRQVFNAVSQKDLQHDLGLTGETACDIANPKRNW